MNPTLDPGPEAAEDPERPPWGTFRPGALFRKFRALSRATPQVPILKQAAFLFRRGARLAGPDPVDVEHRGLRLRLRTRGNISESTFLFMPRRWDHAERRFLRNALGPDPVFVDVGANAGGYVWFVLDRWGDASRILAMEPDPELRARLRFNLRTNGADNVAVVAAAVGPRSGEGWLRLDPDNRGQNVLVDDSVRAARAPRTGAAVAVPVHPLPELVEAAGLPRIDALKIDVEGLEPEILLDFFERAPVSLHPRVLLVEWRSSSEHAALRRHLARLEYERTLRTHLNAGFVLRA